MKIHEPNYAAYWAAALRRHRALIAAGCLSPVGAIRVGKGKQDRDEDEAQDEAAAELRGYPCGGEGGER